jgi:DinB family
MCCKWVEGAAMPIAGRFAPGIGFKIAWPPWRRLQGRDSVSDVDVFRTFAGYNQWMNQKVYEVCARIDDAERRRDRGAFFKSIHGTLNHLLFGDRSWMGRLSGRQYQMAPMGVDLYDDPTPCALRARTWIRIFSTGPQASPRRGFASRSRGPAASTASRDPAALAPRQPSVQPPDPPSRPADHALVPDGPGCRLDRSAVDGGLV